MTWIYRVIPDEFRVFFLDWISCLSLIEFIFQSITLRRPLFCSEIFSGSLELISIKRKLLSFAFKGCPQFSSGFTFPDLSCSLCSHQRRTVACFSQYIAASPAPQPAFTHIVHSVWNVSIHHPQLLSPQSLPFKEALTQRSFPPRSFLLSLLLGIILLL